MTDRFNDIICPLHSRFEGGFADAPTDAGGATGFGQSQRALDAFWRNPKVKPWLESHLIPKKAEELSIEHSRLIALEIYWNRPGIYQLPPPFDIACFDFYYNGGPSIASLQRLVGLKPGRIGPITAAAVMNYPDKKALIDAYLDRRLRYLKGIPGPKGWISNGKGWAWRVEELRKVCQAELSQAAGSSAGRPA